MKNRQLPSIGRRLLFTSVLPLIGLGLAQAQSRIPAGEKEDVHTFTRNGITHQYKLIESDRKTEIVFLNAPSECQNQLRAAIKEKDEESLVALNPGYFKCVEKHHTSSAKLADTKSTTKAASKVNHNRLVIGDEEQEANSLNVATVQDPPAGETCDKSELYDKSKVEDLGSAAASIASALKETAPETTKEAPAATTEKEKIVAEVSGPTGIGKVKDELKVKSVAAKATSAEKEVAPEVVADSETSTDVLTALEEEVGEIADLAEAKALAKKIEELGLKASKKEKEDYAQLLVLLAEKVESLEVASDDEDSRFRSREATSIKKIELAKALLKRARKLGRSSELREDVRDRLVTLERSYQEALVASDRKTDLRKATKINAGQHQVTLQSYYSAGCANPMVWGSYYCTGLRTEILKMRTHHIELQTRIAQPRSATRGYSAYSSGFNGSVNYNWNPYANYSSGFVGTPGFCGVNINACNLPLGGTTGFGGMAGGNIGMSGGAFVGASGQAGMSPAVYGNSNGSQIGGQFGGQFGAQYNGQNSGQYGAPFDANGGYRQQPQGAIQYGTTPQGTQGILPPTPGQGNYGNPYLMN